MKNESNFFNTMKNNSISNFKYCWNYYFCHSNYNIFDCIIHLGIHLFDSIPYSELKYSTTYVEKGKDKKREKRKIYLTLNLIFLFFLLLSF